MLREMGAEECGLWTVDCDLRERGYRVGMEKFSAEGDSEKGKRRAPLGRDAVSASAASHPPALPQRRSWPGVRPSNGGAHCPGCRIAFTWCGRAEFAEGPQGAGDKRGEESNERAQGACGLGSVAVHAD